MYEKETPTSGKRRSALQKLFGFIVTGCRPVMGLNISPPFWFVKFDGVVPASAAAA